MRLNALCALVAVFATACAPGLMIARRAPPLVDPGAQVRRLSVTPQGDPGLALQVQQLLEQKLASSGEYAVVTLCDGQPCGPIDGWVRVDISPVVVKAPEPGKADTTTSVTLNMTFSVVRADGTLVASNSRNTTQSGYVPGSTTVDVLVHDGAEELTRGFVQDIVSRTISESIELDDAGPLKEPVKLATDGDLPAAKAGFEALVVRDPNLAGAHYDLGVLAEVSGQFDLARQLYAKAASLSPKALYVDATPKLERRLADGRALQGR